jgi:hypothetical protein
MLRESCITQKKIIASLQRKLKKDLIQVLICFCFFRLVTWWIRPSTSTRTESLRKSARKLWSTSCWPTPSSGSSASGSTSRSSTRKQNFNGRDSSIQEKERSRPEGQSRQIKSIVFEKKYCVYFLHY